MSYAATERRWVRRLLARLTPEQRRRYEIACRTAPRDPRTGRLYDRERAAIAEKIMYEDALKSGAALVHRVESAMRSYYQDVLDGGTRDAP